MEVAMLDLLMLAQRLSVRKAFHFEGSAIVGFDDDDDKKDDFSWLFDDVTSEGGTMHYSDGTMKCHSYADEEQKKNAWPSRGIGYLRDKHPEYLHILIASSGRAPIEVPTDVDIVFFIDEPQSQARARSLLFHILEYRHAEDTSELRERHGSVFDGIPSPFTKLSSF
jgi:hypothetical protein